MDSSFFFRATVTDPDTHGSSTSYLITVNTNLDTYSEHGQQVDPQAPEKPFDEEGEGKNSDDDLAEMVSRLRLVPERRVAVRKTYSDFVKFRDALEKSGLPGADRLPPMPAKRLFGSQDAKVVEERAQAFRALLEHVGTSAPLATAEDTAAFLWAPAKPDYASVHAQAVAQAKEVASLSTEGWEVKYDKRDIRIAVKKTDASPFYLVKTETLVPLPVETVLKHYKDIRNWKLWMPDATFKEIERVGEHDACVMLGARLAPVSYKIPVISNRDSCVYEASSPGLAWDPVSKAHFSMFATSVDHPECPKRRGWVRAHLRVSVTIFDRAGADGMSTKITSIQHSDPRGQIPPNVINQTIVRGKHLLKEMRRVMVEKLT